MYMQAYATKLTSGTTSYRPLVVLACKIQQQGRPSAVQRTTVLIKGILQCILILKDISVMAEVSVTIGLTIITASSQHYDHMYVQQSYVVISFLFYGSCMMM